MRSICTSIVATLVLAGSSFAATINVPADYTTIQAAVDAASNGDEILVAPGTYTDTQDGHVVDMKAKAITLRSTDGAAVTIIDGQNARRGIACYQGETNATVIDGFTITGGSADDGGGIYCYSSSPTLTGCTISNNTASNSGGGIYCYSSSPTLTGCTISNNTASNSGGGIYCTNSDPTLTNCEISGNTTHYGGGIYCTNSDPTLTNCEISGNTATYNGGGIRCSSSSPTISGCEISNNTAYDGGGIYCYSNSSPTISGCTISDNTASGTYSDGGGIYCFGGSPTISGCDISNNTATNKGGGIYCITNSSSPTLTDTVVCENAPDNIYGSWTDGGGACIAYYCQDSDGNGVPDKCDGSIGDGIHEVPSEYATVQEAINAAGYGDTVLVAPGTYTGTGDWVINPLGKPITIRATGTPEETILDGEGARSVVRCSSGEGTDTIIEGFTITGGSADDGGGIYCYSSSPTLTDCTISGNTANDDGGGISCYSNSSPTISGCEISNNTAYDGGGIYCQSSSPTLTDCTITNNTADGGGGGIYCYSSSHLSDPTLTDCTITNNTADGGGGGIYCYSSSPTLTNCTITNNTVNTLNNGACCVGTSCSLTTEVDCGGDYLGDGTDCANSPCGGGDCPAGEIEDCNGNCAPDYWVGDGYCDDGTYTWNGIPIYLNCDGFNCDGGDCLCGEGGGGIYCQLYSNPTLTDTVVCENAPDNIYGSWTDGGGVCLAYSCQDSDGNGVPDKCDGSVGDGIHEVPSEYATVQEAINAAGYGDTVLVAPGTYTGTGDWVIDPLGKPITIRASGTPEETILDGEGQRRVVKCSSGEGADTIIEGFTITGGSAVNGGGIFCSGGSPTITDCTISGNTASETGGGVHIGKGDTAVISGCTITDNTSKLPYSGGGVYSECQYWHNPAAAAMISDSILCGNIPNQISGPWVDGGGVCSVPSCNDSDNDGLPDKCASVGDGVHEVPSEYPTIQEAVDAAGQGDLVLVSPGTWYGTGHEVLDFKGKSITVQSTDGAAVTIIDGQGTHRGITFYSGELSSTIIDGFTIQNGNVESGSSSPYAFDDDGGGILCAGTSPQIMNCIIGSNRAHVGGGILLASSEAIIDHCAVSKNAAVAAGGIMMHGGAVQITASQIQGNSSDFLGGGMYLYGAGDDGSGEVMLTDSTISENIDAGLGGFYWRGGGILMIHGRLIANNCSIANNTGGMSGGGGITCSDSYVELIGCDVSSNVTTTGVGGGIKDDGLNVVGGAPCEIFVEGCTFIGNYSTDSEAGAAMYLSDGGDGLITSTLVCGSGPDPLHGPWLDGGGNDIDEECSDCPDVDGDGMVGVNDVLAVVAAWGSDDPDADVDGDGTVGTNDLLAVIGTWGPCE